MGYVLHARARTPLEVRREIQHSQESLIALSKRCGVNPKTFEKWRKRSFVHDVPMGPEVVHSTSLVPMEEAVVVAFRVFTQLPLDDCLYSLQETIRHLTRSSLHRCLQRHGVSRLPKESLIPKRKNSKSIPSAIFTWILTKCGPRKVAYTFLPPSIGRRSSPARNCTPRRRGPQPKSFWGILYPQCHIKYTLFLLITGFSSLTENKTSWPS